MGEAHEPVGDDFLPQRLTQLVAVAGLGILRCSLGTPVRGSPGSGEGLCHLLSLRWPHHFFRAPP